MQKFLIVLLIISLLLEGILSSAPFVLVSLFLLAVKMKNTKVFLISFLAGTVLDIFLLRQPGQSSVFFLITLFLIFLYERKYEIDTLLFVALGLAITTFAYFFVFPASQSFLMIVFSVSLGSLIYSLLQKIWPKRNEHYSLS